MAFRNARFARRFILAAATGAATLVTLVPAADAAVRVSQNWRMASDSSAYRGKDMIALAVNPANPQHIVASNADYHDETCEATASFDGGVTWTEAVHLVPPAPPIGVEPFLPSCRVSNHLGESMFQTIAFGTGQNVYAASITPRVSQANGEGGAAAIVYKSTNGGVTWSPGVVAMAGGPGGSGPAGGPYYELPTLAVDAGGGAGGQDLIYVAAREVTGNGNTTGCATASCPSVHVTRSTDGAQTFAAPVQASPAGVSIAGPDSSSQPVIGPDDSVGIAWRTAGGTGEVQFSRSTNQGATWSTPVTVTGVTNVSRAGNSHVTTAISGGSSFPRLAQNRTNGNLYIVYNQGPPGPTGTYLGADHFIPPDSHVYFQRSLDNGATWSTPKRVNDATGHPGAVLVQTRHPDVSVAPNGRVDIVWQDRRHWYQGRGNRTCLHTHIACDDPRLGDTYLAYSFDHGASFSKDRRISDHSHNNDIGYDYRFGTGWTVGPNAAAINADELLIGWMDAREGSFDTDTQDIYLAKVNFADSSPVPKTQVAGADPVALSVKLSKMGYQGGGESTLASTFATKNSTRVVIVNQSDFAGALAGSVLARANLAPVLLSPAGGLPDAVKAEITRLNPIGAFVIGDTSSLSAQVEADLAGLGIDVAQIARVSGADAASTAAAIATRMDKREAAEVTAAQSAFDAAIIANPNGPDAAAAAGLAAARRLPILYVGTTNVPAATTAALTALNIDKTLVIGGTGQIAASVLGSLPSPTRLGGADQYGTSKSVAAESAARGLPSNVVYVADGSRPMDAALLGAVVGRATGIMVLSEAPLASSASETALAAGLTPIDRFVLLNAPAPVVTPPPPPPPGAAPPPPPPPAATPAVCGSLKVVRSNASRSTVRTDTRVSLPCAGRLTATASTKARVRGRMRTVRLSTRIVRLSGSNRAIRVNLTNSSVRSQLRRTGKLVITVRATFTPSTLSATSKVSRRTITFTVRPPRTARR